MNGNTGIRVRVDESPDDGVRNSVRLDVAAGSSIESVVLAFRRGGELVELAEREAPATAELHGELE